MCDNTSTEQRIVDNHILEVLYLNRKYLYCISGDIFLLVFSMDSRESFEEVVRLREQILETKLSACASANSSGSGRKKASLSRVPMVIVGNKCDKDMR